MAGIYLVRRGVCTFSYYEDLDIPKLNLLLSVDKEFAEEEKRQTQTVTPRTGNGITGIPS